MMQRTSAAFLSCSPEHSQMHAKVSGKNATKLPIACGSKSSKLLHPSYCAVPRVTFQSPAENHSAMLPRKQGKTHCVCTDRHSHALTCCTTAINPSPREAHVLFDLGTSAPFLARVCQSSDSPLLLFVPQAHADCCRTPWTSPQWPQLHHTMTGSSEPSTVFREMQALRATVLKKAKGKTQAVWQTLSHETQSCPVIQ